MTQPHWIIDLYNLKGIWDSSHPFNIKEETGAEGLSAIMLSFNLGRIKQNKLDGV